MTAAVERLRRAACGASKAVVIVDAAVGLLAVLVPLILTLHGRVVAEIGEVRRDVHAVAERVARIKGAMNPWRPPANGTPAAATSSPPEGVE